MTDLRIALDAMSGDHGAAVVLPANRCMRVEAQLPTAQWRVWNANSACQMGFLVVHKLLPIQLSECAKAAAAAPPYCALRAMDPWQPAPWRDNPPRSVNGSTRTCACEEEGAEQ